MGDINSHSPSWGYLDLGSKGEEVEDWIIINQMVLINHPDDPHTYYSRAWRTTSCPDLAIATDDVAKITRHHVDQQHGGSDHKPVILHIKQDSQPTNIKHYQEESSVKLSRERTRQVREQLKQKQEQPPTDSCMTEAISMEEV